MPKIIARNSIRLYEDNRETKLYDWRLLRDGSIIILNTPAPKFHLHFFKKNHRPMAVVTADGKTKEYSKPFNYTLKQLNTKLISQILRV